MSRARQRNRRQAHSYEFHDIYNAVAMPRGVLSHWSTGNYSEAGVILYSLQENNNPTHGRQSQTCSSLSFRMGWILARPRNASRRKDGENQYGGNFTNRGWAEARLKGIYII